MLSDSLLYIRQFRIASLVFILLGTLTYSNCFSQEIDCSNFKKGTFFYTPPNGGEVWIKRTNKKQIEKYNNENQRFIFKITWDNNCSYTLILHRAKGVDKKVRKEIIGTKLECKVLNAELDHYIVTIVAQNQSSNKVLTIYKK